MESKDNAEVISDLEAIRGYAEWEMPLNFIVTLDNVIEMLKPKKPERNQGTYNCCSCGRKLRFGSGKEYENRDNHCPNCGQVIDWG